MIDVGVAMVWVGVACFGPGLLILGLLAQPRAGIERLALAPAASLALFFLLGEIGLVTGLPVAPVSIVVFLVVVAALVFWARRRYGGATDEPTPPRTGGPALVLLVAAVVVGLAVWVGGFRDGAAIPLNYDAAHHGFLVAARRRRRVDRPAADPGRRRARARQQQQLLPAGGARGDGHGASSDGCVDRRRVARAADPVRRARTPAGHVRARPPVGARPAPSRGVHGVARAGHAPVPVQAHLLGRAGADRGHGHGSGGRRGPPGCHGPGRAHPAAPPGSPPPRSAALRW